MTRVTQFDEKLIERNQILQQFGEALEQKVDLQMGEVRHQIDMEMDKKVQVEAWHELKTEIIGAIDKIDSEIANNKIESQKKHETIISGFLR